MDLLILCGLVIVFGFIFITMGLSYISQSLGATDYNAQWGSMTTEEYYRNPLYRFSSKWFHYRPKGAVVLSKLKWEEIEKNIGLEVLNAKNKGIALGRAQLCVEMEDTIKNQQMKLNPVSPYEVLGVQSSEQLLNIEERYKHLIGIYDPRNFVDLDKGFVELAEIRTKQIKKAWQLVNTAASTKGKTNG